MRHPKTFRRTPLLIVLCLGTLAMLLFARVSTDLNSDLTGTTSSKPSLTLNEDWEPAKLTPEEWKDLDRFAEEQIDPKDGRMWRLDSQRFTLSGNVGQPRTKWEEKVKEFRYFGLLEPLEPPVEKLLLQANLNWMSGNRIAAKSKWTAVTVKFPLWEDQVLDARLNLARAALLEKKVDIAIQTLLPILGRPDPEIPSLGDHFDKWIACRELSDLYLEQGDLTNALKYLNLARNKYKSRQCALASDWEEEEYSARAKVIKHALLTKTKLEVKPLKPTIYRRRSDSRGIASNDVTR